MIKGNWVKSLDYIGKFLLCWFVLETILYYGSGRFFIELEDCFYLFRIQSIGEALHLLLMIAVSGLIIVIMGPFLLEGRWVGIILAILYWFMGNTINPLLYIIPGQWLGTPDEPTTFLSAINVAWYGMVLLGMAGFFYFRRWKPGVEPQTDHHGEEEVSKGAAEMKYP